jgi:Ca2+-binding RTX toxin-like protein
MRSHLAHRILLMLLIALLAGALAAPADAKRPRRYEDVYLMNWDICPAGAQLTIGAASAQTGTVKVDAQLPSAGTSLIEGGLKEIELVPDGTETIEWNNLVDEEVMDDDPAAPDDRETITHRAVLSLVWSERVDAGKLIRLSLSVEFAPRWGQVRVNSCEPTPPGGGGDGGNSPGVTTPGTPVSKEEIQDLTQEIGKNSQTGTGRGGSVVPRSECTIAGTPDDDRIAGTRGNDVICGFGGNDVIDGGGGSDLIDAADGNDRVGGGSSKDVLLGLRGNDRLKGNGGGDSASGGAGDDRVRGSSGDDLVSGGSGDDYLTGGKDIDIIRGGSGGDRINARDHTRDMVNGGGGQDIGTLDGFGEGRPESVPRQADRVRGVEQLQ